MRDLLSVLGVMALCGWLTALPLLFMKKAPARLRLKMLLIPLAMLLCPLPLFCRRTIILPAAETVLPDLLPAADPLSAAPTPSLPAAGPAFTLGAEVFAVVWGVGLLFSLLVQLSGWITLRHRFAKRSPADDAAKIFALLCKEMNIRRPPQVLLCAEADTPLLTGIFRPVILLPETSYTDEELRLILRHELTHHKQGHLILQAAARLAAAVHWFHPLGYLLLRWLPEACENACDETVAEKMTSDERKRYGLVILRFAGRSFGGCAAFAAKRGKDPRSHMERRLKAVMEPRRISTKIRLLTVLAACAVLMAGCGVSYTLAPEAVKQAAPSSADIAEDPAPPAGEVSEPAVSAPESEDTTIPDNGDVLEESPSESGADASDGETAPQEKEVTESVPEITHYPAQCWPLPGHTTITAEFGGSHDHHGIDISGENVAGAPVAAWRTGKVVFAGYDTQHGNCILIDHGDGLCSFYAHCESLAVKEGENVAVGQTIAAAGATGMATGPHLHFELRQDGEAINPSAYFPLSYPMQGETTDAVCSYPKAEYFQGESHHEESSGHHSSGHH